MAKPNRKKAAAVAVAETLTLLIAVNPASYAKLTVQADVADNALDQFVVKGKTHPDADDITIASAGADFTSPSGSMIEASGDLTTQAVGSGYFVMNTFGYYEISVYAASGNVAGSTVDAFASLSA